MDKMTACNLARGSNIYEKCVDANRLTNGWNKPFSPSDLALIRFGMFVSECSQREKDLIFVSNNLASAHLIVNVSLKVLHEFVPEDKLKIVKHCHDAMVRLGIESLLDGYNEFAEEFIKVWEF